MKIINLIEDTKGVEGCHYEHGLSFYIETKKHKLLLDTGATAAFIDNAKVLHICCFKSDVQYKIKEKGYLILLMYSRTCFPICSCLRA